MTDESKGVIDVDLAVQIHVTAPKDSVGKREPGNEFEVGARLRPSGVIFPIRSADGSTLLPTSVNQRFPTAPTARLEIRPRTREGNSASPPEMLIRTSLPPLSASAAMLRTAIKAKDARPPREPLPIRSDVSDGTSR